MAGAASAHVADRAPIAIVAGRGVGHMATAENGVARVVGAGVEIVAGDGRAAAAAVRTDVARGASVVIVASVEIWFERAAVLRVARVVRATVVIIAHDGGAAAHAGQTGVEGGAETHVVAGRAVVCGRAGAGAGGGVTFPHQMALVQGLTHDFVAADALAQQARIHARAGVAVVAGEAREQIVQAGAIDAHRLFARIVAHARRFANRGQLGVRVDLGDIRVAVGNNVPVDGFGVVRLSFGLGLFGRIAIGEHLFGVAVRQNFRVAVGRFDFFSLAFAFAFLFVAVHRHDGIVATRETRVRDAIHRRRPFAIHDTDDRGNRRAIRVIANDEGSSHRALETDRADLGGRAFASRRLLLVANPLQAAEVFLQ